MNIAERIDSSLTENALVFGSPPPDGRDLDLLAGPASCEQIANVLRQHGYLRSGVQWACFTGGRPPSVELLRVDRLRLPAQEEAALFAEAQRLDGFNRLLRPAPHHVLLLLARRHARSRGELSPRLRRRVAAAVAESGSAWEIARERAPQWQARAALARLEQTYRTATAGSLRLRAASLLELGRAAASSPAATRSHLRTVIRLRRGPMIVALSGLDGAGKSSQAQLIERSMRSIGVESAVIWPPARNVLFGMPPALKDRLRRLLATIGRPIETSSTTAYQAADGAPEFPPLPSQRGIVTELLAAVVAISQVLALRRAALAAPGDPVLLIYDRYVLDSIVYLKDRWGHGRALGWQSAAIRMLARRAALSYLLEIEPEEAFARKQDFPIENLRDRAALYRRLHESLGVKALDATRPMQEVGHEICGDIWMMLGLGR